ncbi:MAG: hypothetical protein SGI98_12900 [Verrucomicrobiota bacterium]|nr:hypothetical protein [Verrucomicrobiota bacterium]
MDIDHIFKSLTEGKVDYILIGGVNFLLNHEPILTYDVDIWFRNTAENKERLNNVLAGLGAKWGESAETFRPIPESPEWLDRQVMFCVTTDAGSLDIFREVKGLEGCYEECFIRSSEKRTNTGISYRSLSDGDMLACQMALDPRDQKLDRIKVLKLALKMDE